jgi:hypothetical protein
MCRKGDNIMKNNNVRIELHFDHRSFKITKLATVMLPESDNASIDYYANQAKETVCSELNIPMDEVTVLDCSYDGPDEVLLNLFGSV